MKKFLTVVLFAMMSLEIFAQKISVDRIENNGSHQIMASTKAFSIEGAEFNFGLKVFDRYFGTDWCLLISSYYFISQSAELLIKLGNDEVIYKRCNNVNVGQISSSGYSYKIGSITTYSPPRKDDYYSSIFDLSIEDLDKIEQYGIKKIRISNGVKSRDKEFPTNKLGKYLIKSRRKIQERLNNPIQKKGLFEDF